MRRRKSILERGQGLVEYALILVLVSVVVIVILSVTGQKITEIFCDITIKIGGKANIAACASPRVTITGLSGSGGNYPVEAIVTDDKGNTEPNIVGVEFFVDGVSDHTENQFHYCLQGSNDNCPTYHFSSGTHTVRAVVRDADGNRSETSVTFTVP